MSSCLLLQGLRVSFWHRPHTQQLPTDLFGVVLLRKQAFGRDIEPTLEDGSLLYDITTSCLRVYRSKTPSCDAHTKELCCNGARLTWRQCVHSVLSIQTNSSKESAADWR